MTLCSDRLVKGLICFKYLKGFLSAETEEKEKKGVEGQREREQKKGVRRAKCFPSGQRTLGAAVLCDGCLYQ